MVSIFRICLVGTLVLLFCSFVPEKVSAQKLSGTVRMDGSSTVYPIAEAMAKEFKVLHPGVNISIGISGTGGGFKKFYAGETDISDASRPIKDSEAAECKKNGIEYIELKVGTDGLAVIVNKENTWAKNMTLEDLKKIWHPNTDSFKNATKWNDVNPAWPDEKIQLYGPGTNSGTFDYFTDEVNGKEGRCRPDFTGSEDDNSILKGIQGNKFALGYLGYAYYESQKENLRAVALAKKQADPFVTPSPEVVKKHQYILSRPLFIYVKTSSLKRPEVKEFVEFFLRRKELVTRAGYVELDFASQFKETKVLKNAIQAINGN